MSTPSYRELLSNNDDYRRLWLGELVSFLGDWFSTIALYEIVQTWTGSALAIAGVMICKTLPVFLMVPVAGPLVDRLDRRWLMIMTDLVRAACVLGLMVAAAVESLPLLLGVLVVLVAGSGVFVPARTASIPMLVDRDAVPVAMALSGGTWSVMLAFGAALGGLVTHAIGVQGSLLLDALTYLISAGLLAGLPALPAEPSESDQTGFIEGLAYLAREPEVRLLAAGKSVMALASGGVVMLPIVGNGLYPATAGPLFVGLLYASRGVGALVGSVGVRRLTGDGVRTMERSLGVALCIVAVGMVVVAASPNMGAAMLGYALAGTGSGIVWVYTGTLLQIVTHEDYRGRVFAMEFGVMTLAVSATAALSGVAVDASWLEPREVLWASGALVVCVGLPWAGLVLLRSDHQGAAPA